MQLRMVTYESPLMVVRRYGGLGRDLGHGRLEYGFSSSDDIATAATTMTMAAAIPPPAMIIHRLRFGLPLGAPPRWCGLRRAGEEGGRALR